MVVGLLSLRLCCDVVYYTRLCYVASVRDLRVACLLIVLVFRELTFVSILVWIVFVGVLLLCFVWLWCLRGLVGLVGEFVVLLICSLFGWLLDVDYFVVADGVRVWFSSYG